MSYPVDLLQFTNPFPKVCRYLFPIDLGYEIFGGELDWFPRKPIDLACPQGVIYLSTPRKFRGVDG